MSDFDPNTFRGMRQLIAEDLATHGGDKTRPGFKTLKAYRFGVWRMNVPQPFRAPLSLWYRRQFRHCRDVYGIELPYAATVGRRLTIEHQHGIVVHGECVIGDDCFIRQGVTLGNKSLDKPFDAPVLGNGVNVGAGAKVLGKVTLGDRAQVGANAVVVKDVSAGTTVVGIPAKPIGGSK
jgi:serine O-acetyltransferase